MVTAHGVVVTVVNKTNPGEALQVGDSAAVSFQGLSQPVQKMAGIYNPGFPDTCWVQYNTLSGRLLRSTGVQYNMISSNTIEFTADEPGEFKMVRGCIHAAHLGSPLGTHRSIPDTGMEPNFNAGTGANSPYFSSLPDITLRVAGSQTQAEQQRFSYAHLTKGTKWSGFDWGWQLMPISGNWDELNQNRNMYLSGHSVQSYIKPLAANGDNQVTARFRLPYAADPTNQAWRDLGELTQGRISNLTHWVLGEGIQDPDGGWNAPRAGQSENKNIIGDSGDLIEIEVTVTPRNPADGYAQTYVWRTSKALSSTDQEGAKEPSYLIGLKLEPAGEQAALPGTDGQLKAVDPDKDLGYGFLMSQNSYRTRVPNGVSSITLTPAVRTNYNYLKTELAIDQPAIVTVNGQAVESGAASQAIPLGVGENTITVTTHYSGQSQVIPEESTYTILVTRDDVSAAVTFTGMEQGADLVVKSADGRTLYPQGGAYQLTAGRSYTYYYSKPGCVTAVGAVEMTAGITEIPLPPLQAVNQRDGRVTVRIAGPASMLRQTTELSYTVNGAADLAQQSYVEYNHGGYTVLHALIDACTTGNYRVAFKCYKGSFAPDLDLSKLEYAAGAGWVCEVNARVVTDLAGTLVKDGDQIEFYYNVNNPGMLHAWFSQPEVTITQGGEAAVTLLGAPVKNNGAAVQPIAGAEIFLGAGNLGKTDENGRLSIGGSYLASPGTYRVTARKNDEENKNTLTYSLCTIVVKKIPASGGNPDQTVVTFRLIGATTGGDVEGYNNYVTWIPTTTFTYDKPSVKVAQIFTDALDRAGLTYIGLNKNYIKTITAPEVCGGYALSEFTNGQRSGWMYTVNGFHPEYGLNDFAVTTGDVIVWHYVNDYMYEVEDWYDGTWGNDSTWSKWLEAADTEPTAGGSPGSSAGSPGTLAPKVTAKDGVAKVSVSTADLSAVIADAVKNGSSNIVIKPEISGGAAKITVELPKESLAALVSDTGIGLKVNTPAGNVTIPNDALSAIVSQADGSTIIVSLEAVETKTLSAREQELVGGDQVYDISILSGGKAISSFDGKALTVLLPYTLKPGESAGSVAVWYLNDAGRLERMICKYDEKTGLASFTVNHFSRYLIGYAAPWTNPFSDVKESDWFYGPVKYAMENQLFAGISATIFGPNTALTRAMLITVLHRMENRPPVTSASTFADVKAGQWYAESVAWAAAKGIVSGYGGGLFGPNDPVTRQQMASILYRYADAKGFDVTGRTELTKYTDAASVGGWAADVMKWAVAESLIAGTAETKLSPTAPASRAQGAAVLQRFAENTLK
ncbi:MAG: S-layer homology domain-containing protein [Peptococcaceae bacterium]|nr:S-layer homology domain-containing protein [Peptococcaceae bacterium]